MTETWVGWDGGPMMLIPEGCFGAWTGTGDREGDGDYWDVLAKLEQRSPCLHPVAGGTALILESSSEPEATWIPSADGTGGVVAMLEYADDLDPVPDLVRSLDPAVWQDTGLVIELPGDRQLLVSPALTDDLDAARHQLLVALPRGRYTVAEHYYADDRTGLTLFRLSGQ